MLKKYSFGKSPRIVARKSLTAYIKPIGIWSVFWIFASAISWILSLVFIAIGLFIFLYINSIKLFVDEKGVWVIKGVFPWDKGIYGTKWCDFGQALFYQNPVSWSFSSYTLLVKNKYKKEEFKLKNMHNGDKAVARINTISMRIKL